LTGKTEGAGWAHLANDNPAQILTGTAPHIFPDRSPAADDHFLLLPEFHN